MVVTTMWSADCQDPSAIVRRNARAACTRQEGTAPMTVSRSRKALLTGTAALGVVLGAAGITAAATNNDTRTTNDAETADTPSYTSSITAPPDADVTNLA